MFRNWRKIFCCCCCCFWILWTIFTGNLRQRQQSQKSHAAQGQNTVHKVICSTPKAASVLVVWDWPGISGGQGDKTKPDASRKMKMAGCGGDGEREQLVNIPKISVNAQTNHSGERRCCVTYLPKLFQQIFLSFWLLLFSWSHLSLFVLPCFQKGSSVLTEMGHVAQLFQKQVLCCLQWKASVEQYLDVLFLAAVIKTKMPGERMP